MKFVGNAPTRGRSVKLHEFLDEGCPPVDSKFKGLGAFGCHRNRKREVICPTGIVGSERSRRDNSERGPVSYDVEGAGIVHVDSVCKKRVLAVKEDGEVA